MGNNDDSGSISYSGLQIWPNHFAKPHAILCALVVWTSILVIASVDCRAQTSATSGVSQASVPSGSETAAYTLETNKNEFGLWPGGSFGLPSAIPGSRDRSITELTGLRYGRVLAAGGLVALEYTFGSAREPSARLDWPRTCLRCRLHSPWIQAVCGATAQGQALPYNFERRFLFRKTVSRSQFGAIQLPVDHRRGTSDLCYAPACNQRRVPHRASFKRRHREVEP
jgi:hypothetical protein